MWSDWLVVRDCSFSLSAPWPRLSVPTVLPGFLPLGRGASLHGCCSRGPGAVRRQCGCSEGRTDSVHQWIGDENRRRKEGFGMSPMGLNSATGRILSFNQNKNGLEWDQGKDGAKWAKIICLGHTKRKVSTKRSVTICIVAFVCVWGVAK